MNLKSEFTGGTHAPYPPRRAPSRSCPAMASAVEEEEEEANLTNDLRSRAVPAVRGVRVLVPGLVCRDFPIEADGDLSW